MFEILLEVILLAQFLSFICILKLYIYIYKQKVLFVFIVSVYFMDYVPYTESIKYKKIKDKELNSVSFCHGSLWCE